MSARDERRADIAGWWIDRKTSAFFEGVELVAIRDANRLVVGAVRGDAAALGLDELLAGAKSAAPGAPVCAEHGRAKVLLSNGRGGRMWRCRPCLRRGEADYRNRYKVERTRGAS